MFFVGFLLSYVIPIFHTTLAFNFAFLLHHIRDDSQGKGRACVTDARMAYGGHFSS
jgi:hypothetical protein